MISGLTKCVIITLITHLDEAHHDTPDTAYRERSGDSDRRAAPARLGRPRERPVRKSTRRNYAGQFRAWCEHEEQPPLQAVQTHGRWKSPQMPARYTRGGEGAGVALM